MINSFIRRLVVITIESIAGLIFLLLLPVIALARMVPRREIPAIVWGQVPIINIKYHSEALKKRRYNSITVVDTVYTSLYKVSDFDVVYGVVGDTNRIVGLYKNKIKPLLIFVWLLFTRDIFCYFFDGGYLKGNYLLRWLELPLLKIGFRKKIIVMPYGSDVTIPSMCPDIVRRYVTGKDYPSLAINEKKTARQVQYFIRWADAVITGGALIDYLPRTDYIIPSFLAFDIESWPACYGPPRKPGETFRVLHAPNHRMLKGTEFVIAAVDRLKKRGVNIELLLAEKMGNAELLEIMASCHAVAEQFIGGWHGLFAVESMARGKPVLCYLREDVLRLYTQYSYSAELPIVNTTVAQIEEKLLWLYENPETCESLGRAGRSYVEKYHSEEAVGKEMESIINTISVRR